MLTAIDACILTRKTTGITREFDRAAGQQAVHRGIYLASTAGIHVSAAHAVHTWRELVCAEVAEQETETREPEDDDEPRRAKFDPHVILYAADGTGDEIELPAVYGVCPRCQGRGTHVNPAIDGNGLTREDFDEDPDFEESYFRGDYDVQCYECRGKRVVAVLDRKRCSKADAAAYDRQLDDLAEVDAIHAAEIRMGC
jgi:hypothetical protein